MFEIIDTPFSPVKTVRLDNRGDFRPCSTGVNIDELKIRTLMERAEVDYTSVRRVIASAAHTDRELSMENAWQEAIERISLAAWWKFRRPAVARLSEQSIDEMLYQNHIEKPGDFSVDVGFVESLHPDYYVAYSILSNDESYPFAVLGGGCSKSATLAAEKALYEAIQSWTATEWIDSHKSVEQKVYWDIGELNTRIASLSDTPTELPERVPPQKDLLDKLNTQVFFHDGLYVAEITELGEVSHTTLELARFAMKDGEKNLVFTPHNL